MGRLRIRQVKSGCNAQKSQKATLRALGLKHHQAVVEKEDGPTIRGMVRAVRHLVQVEEIE
ncbi:MAG: 50S ribosomal protein L30 [Gemmatimonadota bacterium]